MIITDLKTKKEVLEEIENMWVFMYFIFKEFIIFSNFGLYTIILKYKMVFTYVYY